MANKEKEIKIIDFHRAHLAQLDIDLDRFVGECQKLDLDSTMALDTLMASVQDFVGDVQNYINNFKMTDGIVNVGNDGKPALRGNQSYVKEQQFFLENAKQTDPKKRRPFISYKEFGRKIFIENNRREKAGEKLLIDISSATYENWKSKYK
jgi:hypothetical protein